MFGALRGRMHPLGGVRAGAVRRRTPLFFSPGGGFPSPDSSASLRSQDSYSTDAAPFIHGGRRTRAQWVRVSHEVRVSRSAVGGRLCNGPACECWPSRRGIPVTAVAQGRRPNAWRAESSLRLPDDRPFARRLYIAHQGDGSILIVDLVDRRILGRIGELPNVHGVLVVPALHRLFATAARASPARHDRHPHRPRSQPHSGRGRAGRHRVRPGRTTRVRLRRAASGSAHRRRCHDRPTGGHHPAQGLRWKRPVRPRGEARTRRRRDSGRARAGRPDDAADHTPSLAPGLRRQSQPGGRRVGSAVDRRLLCQRSPARR